MPSKTPTVWIVQESVRRINNEWRPIHDTRSAERYGERRTILNAELKTWNPAPACRMIEQILPDYDPAWDYLMLIGSPIFGGIAMAMFAAAASEAGATHIRLLYWSSRERSYVEIPVPLADMGF